MHQRPALRFDEWTRVKPVIGMLHLAPLPGSPQASQSLAAITERALSDAAALAAGGCHALMMENFGDVPFYPGRVPAVVVAAMTAIAAAVRRQTPLPLGINVLRNDGQSALAVAIGSGAEFIRVNVLSGARVTDQGLIQGIAHDLLRDKAQLGATGVRILADADVKHAAPLAARDLGDEVKDLLLRGLADAVIVSGSGTGQPVSIAKLKTVKEAAQGRPVLIGSGATAASLAELAPYADGFIVGTALKQDGISVNPVDPKRVKEFMAAHLASCRAHLP
ncbi:MAG: BtpA/SgcQ family protein [Proteobacteria bacterium]|nr:BtpA/SgcQ family protein [Pseudomonadota bacterium]